MKSGINRRRFLRNSAAIGAGLYLAPKAVGAETDSKKEKDDIYVALLGAGEQGTERILAACTKFGKKGIKIRAVCDIWPYNLGRASRYIDKFKSYGYKGTAYIDHKEMLAKEKDLDAVIIATPDFWHSRHTIDCLEAGLHVYCEKEMSNTLEGARKMVAAARKTDKLLQIGHQRRSNIVYQFCLEKVIKEMKLPGRITTVNGQWNRSKANCGDLGWPEDQKIDEKTLNKYGYESMQKFRNWRWYKGLGGGPIVDLGSHQIDVYKWFLDALPKSVIASGGTDYWKDHEWYDNVMAIYEFETKEGIVRALYQTLTTSSSRGYHETFMGDEGTLVVSEWPTVPAVYREEYLEKDAWKKWVRKGYIQKSPEPPPAEKQDDSVMNLEPTPPPPKYDLIVDRSQNFHGPHLWNFFQAIRGKEKLNCPAEDAYQTAVMILKVNEAVEAKKMLEFKPEDFKV
jgi:predicted dehydrogenase